MLRADVIDPIIASQNGRVFKRTGDGALVEFRSVVEAVRCAISVQNTMAERNVGTPEDQRIVFRIGIHLGDVVEEADGDLMGDGVNIAARLEGIAPPGAICLSEDAYRQVKGRLDIAVADLGPTQLKNIAESVRAYSLQVDGPAAARSRKSSRGKGAASLAVGAVVALMLLAGGAWWLFGGQRSVAVAPISPPPLAAQRLSVVVLPFANLSGDPGQDYLVDALTDALTTSLARIRDSFVIARNTAMTFKGKQIDVKAIGRELGVRYVLEGSVQPSSDRMRVNAQLIDADSGAHLWAEQFDTPRADLLQTQDTIVARLAYAMDLQLVLAAGARVMRTAVNPSAEDLALRCDAGSRTAGWIGKEADEAYLLCEQALALDPENARALMMLGVKLWLPVALGASHDPKGDLERADQLASKAVALEPNWPRPHELKGFILMTQGRPEESKGEHALALAMDPSNTSAAGGLGYAYQVLGEFNRSAEYLDKAILTSPLDAQVSYWYGNDATNSFGLKNYNKAIELARQSIAINARNFPMAHTILVAALALTGREREAREALQRYVALPTSGQLRTVAAWKARNGPMGGDPRFVEMNERLYDGLRKAGMPEQ